MHTYTDRSSFFLSEGSKGRWVGMEMVKGAGLAGLASSGLGVERGVGIVVSYHILLSLLLSSFFFLLANERLG